MLFRPGQQGTDLGSFERDSRPLGIVFVVIGGQRARLDDGVELAGQRRDAVQGSGPLGIEAVVHRLVLKSGSHVQIIDGFDRGCNG